MQTYDLIVIGGGPAGMTAALYALRNGRSVLLLEKNSFGGQMNYSPRIENYPGIPSISGLELADSMMQQIIDQGAQVELETAVRIEDQGAIKQVHTEEGKYYAAQAVILATGARHRMLGLAGEEELIGNGISFCALCDGDFFAGQDIAVAGGGNSALGEALLLAGICKSVTIVQDLDCLTGEKSTQDALGKLDNVRILTGMRIEELLSVDGHLTGLLLKNARTGEKSTLSCDGLFVAIGLIPDTEAFADQAALNEQGYIDAKDDCLTGHAGIFAAGDCRSKAVRQIATAISDGAVAALAACRYIDSLKN